MTWRRTWRDHARPIICKVLRENAGADTKTLRRKLREAYPYGERKHWPYKIWCDEIHAQLGTGRYKARPTDSPRRPKGYQPPAPNQLQLFEPQQ